MEYVAKVPPDVLAEIAYKWGTMYNAYCVIDITGGMGISTARKLQELSYQGGLYVDNVDTTNKWKWDPKINDKIPGINFNSKRVQIISAFEENVRHGFKVYSSRLYNEMNTLFILTEDLTTKKVIMMTVLWGFPWHYMLQKNHSNL